MPYLKKSDSNYLTTRFQQLQNKGLDRVARKNVFGTKAEIEQETLRILKVGRKRFNKTLEKRNEF